MSVQLDPLVAHKLQQFAKRRRRLILTRGFCAGLVTFLVCVAIVAFADWYWLLSDAARQGLATGVYLPTLLVIWMTSLRRLFYRPAREEIAAQVETVEPELRENLLSAVELATEDPAAIHDSPVFRSLLQGKVAQQMAHIQVRGLLPFKLVAKWLIAAIIVVAVAAVLLTSNDSRFRQLAVRAILPTANIARVSRIHVDVLQPTPHSLMLAEDETIAVIVAVSGGAVDDVTLETFTLKQGSVRQAMRNRSDTEFVSNIHVADESVEYRIHAGDAITERFRIEARPRPRVIAFTKILQFPGYSLLPEQTLTETHGDILALEGTHAQLLLETDQQVSHAELRIDPLDSDELTVIPLTPESESASGLRWSATLPITQASIYKVHLVSKETGFENIFSPKYEIRPQPDLIPRAGFVDQQETTLLLPPNDIVALKAMAEDDLPLVSLEQHVSVNGDEWLALPLSMVPADPTDAPETGGRRVTAAWQWDLLHHRLKTGDQVVTKLVATDRKGNTGESIPLRVIVANQEFDPDRHTLMERKLRLHEHLASFAALLEEHKASALEIIERLRQPDLASQQISVDHTALLDIANKQREQSETLLQTIQEVEQDMPVGADAYELDLTGRVIARLNREHSHVPAYLLKAMQFTDDPKRLTGDMDELKRTFERTADDATNVANHYQYLMSYNFLNALAIDLDSLFRRQQLIVNSPTQTWERLLRQETIVINQFRVLERLAHNHRSSLPRSFDGHMTNLLRWAESQRERLQENTEAEDKLPQLQRVSREVLQQLEQKQKMDIVDGGLPGRLVGAWRDFDNRAGSLYVPLEQMARAAQQEDRLAAQALKSADSVESQKLLDQMERFTAEVDLRHRRSIDQFRIRRQLTQARRDADNQYAADAGLTFRATMSLINQHRNWQDSIDPAETVSAPIAHAPIEHAPTESASAGTATAQRSDIPEQLLEIAPAYRTLEAGHNLILARDVLDLLADMERWGSQDLQSHIDHPRQWDLVQRAFELASQRMREAGVKQEITGKLDQIRWSAATRDANRKITERRWKRDAIVTAGHELTELRKNLSVVVEEMQPIMATAREVIAKYAPTIPQMAQQAADQLRQMEEVTTQAADHAEQATTADESAEKETAAQLAELEQQQRAVNHQIEDLLEALVEDANRQDLVDATQRERARDADDSIALIQQPAAQMNRAMQEARQSDSAEQQAQKLAQAAEQQEKTAKALELVAEHFDRLEEGLDVADSRAELRQAEQESGISQQMERQYVGALQLEQQSALSTEQLMQNLEEELQRNPAMQQALSEITQNTLQEARNALEYAAADDQNLQRANERSDTEFQNQKREIAEDLREMGAEASRLSGMLVAQANQSAAQGKTAEAQKKFAETQQKLNEAAAKASSARDDLLLKDLAQTAGEAQQALTQAADTLKQAKEQSATGKDEAIHADDKAREAQKKDSERRRQQFHEQQKRTANDLVKRAEDAKRRSDQSVRNAENELRTAETKVQQAQNNLNRKPADDAMKRNLAHEQERQRDSRKKVDAAKQVQETTEQKAQLARQQRDEINNKPMPPLDAPNPATQLADQYADEAIQVVEELQQKAEQLSDAAQFGNELTPTQGQLAAAEQQQMQVTQDVHQAAEDVARAARHERRLNNLPVVEPLQKTADQIEQVARNESAGAERQLNIAAAELQRQTDQRNSQSQTPTGQPSAEQGAQPASNAQSLLAQQDLATAERAIAQQADQLSGVLDPILAESQAAAAAQAEAESTTNSTAPALTPEQLAHGQQLARILDELDRQTAARAAQPANAAQPGQPAAPLNSLAQAARAQQASLAAARLQAQQQAVLAMGEGGQQSSNSASEPPGGGDFDVADVNRIENANWGKLRGKSAADVAQGQSEKVSEEYRKSIETYFRVLAERAKQK